MKKLLTILASFLSIAGIAFASDPMDNVQFAKGFQAIEAVPLFGDHLENADFTDGVWSVNDAGEMSASKDDMIWTKEKVGSFDCTFEFKLSEKSNSGFVFQCSNREDWIPNAIEIQLQDDSGMEPTFQSSGSIYGFQAPSKNCTRPAGEWNQMRVLCVGRIIKVWLNGEQVNEIDTAQWTDNAKGPAGTEILEKFHGHSLASVEPYGYIGFQGQHGKEPLLIRNAMIKKIQNYYPDTTAEGWFDLFGKDLENADCDRSVWSVNENGELVSNKDDAIWSKEKYSNFVLDLDFVCTQNANSGIVIKASDKPNWIPNSLEIQVANTYGQPLDHSSCGAVYGRSPVLYNALRPAGEWNHITVACLDDWIFVCLNGELITLMDKSLYLDKKMNPDGTEAYPWLCERAPADLDNAGWIGLQGLHGKDDSVSYRNVKLLPLK